VVSAKVTFVGDNLTVSVNVIDMEVIHPDDIEYELFGAAREILDYELGTAGRRIPWNDVEAEPLDFPEEAYRV